MDKDAVVYELQDKMMQLHNLFAKGSVGESSQGEARILHCIEAYKDKELLPSDLSGMLSLSTARIASVLNSLEKKGLVKREMSSTDRRKILVTITAEGERVVAEKHVKIYQKISHLADELGEDDAKELSRLLGRIVEIHTNGNF